MTLERVINRRRRVGTVVVAICFVSFLVGLSGLYFVPLHFARDTYVSENALQPGMHTTTIGSHVRDMYAWKNATRDVLVENLAAISGLEVIEDDSYVLAIVRSPRGSARSAIVVSTTIEASPSLKHISGLSFSVELAKHLHQRANYVGKDVYFVFANTRGRSSHADFLKRYHDGSVIYKRSGTLQQGIHLDFDFQEGIKSIVFQVEGGRRLPNLDLLNMFVRTALQKGILSRYMLTTKKFLLRSLKLFPTRVGLFLQFFLQQSLWTHVDNEPHSVYNEYATDCLTVTHLGSGASRIRAQVFVNVIEGAVRSLLTLQETLHQSFYFYLLPSPWLYVPIGDYMIVFGLCFAIFPAVVVWMTLFSNAFEKNKNEDQGGSLGHFFRVLIPLVGATSLAMYYLPPKIGLFLYFGALGGIIWVPLQQRQFNARSQLAIIAFSVYSFSLVLCVLINFPLAIVGCVFGVIHMLAYYTGSRLMLLALDPFVLGYAFSQTFIYWDCLILVAVPFRILMIKSLSV